MQRILMAFIKSFGNALLFHIQIYLFDKLTQQEILSGSERLESLLQKKINKNRTHFSTLTQMHKSIFMRLRSKQRQQCKQTDLKGMAQLKMNESQQNWSAAA